jgi:hypothetical protein
LQSRLLKQISNRQYNCKDWYCCNQTNLRQKITGVNLSFFGTLADAQLNGLNIGGLTTQVENINGISVSGLTNSAGVVKGICIALLHNKAATVKGIQIGLVNKAASLRGLQLGLWNRNEKRSLPFINWQFRPKAVK